jgi:hypothetical protein
MKRAFSIVTWTVGAFFSTIIAVTLAAIFASRFTFSLIFGGNETSSTSDFGWAELATLVVALLVAAIFLALGLHGRLPGTMLPAEPTD